MAEWNLGDRVGLRQFDDADEARRWPGHAYFRRKHAGRTFTITSIVRPSGVAPLYGLDSGPWLWSADHLVKPAITNREELEALYD